MAQYRVEILDKDRNPLGVVQQAGNPHGNSWLKYSQKLGAYGEAHLTVSVRDPLFKLGPLFQPYASHIRIYRNNLQVWQGVIVKCPMRTKNMISIVAYDYLFLLTKTLVPHDTAPKDVNFRQFDSGTLADAVTSVINSAVNNSGAGSALKSMTVGTIENPTFPQGYIDTNGGDLSGKPWAFSQYFMLKYDYRDVMYVLNQLGIYSQFDMELTPDLVFNFKKRLGSDRSNDIVFEFLEGVPGTIEDFNAPLDGQRMVNQITGIAADNEFKILKVDQIDSASLNTYGKLEGVAAYGDVKNKNLLGTRLKEELRFVSTPDANVNITLSQNAYPLGQWKIGDTVTLKINHFQITLNSPRRIVGFEVDVHDTGKEQIKLVTNIPRTYT